MCEDHGTFDLNEKPGTIIEYADIKMIPETSSDILCWLKAGSEVIVDPADSTKDYYKVYMASGIEGYCSKRYIKIIS